MDRDLGFGRALRKALDTRGKTQAWLAEMLSVRPSTITAWVQGEALPSGEHMVRLPELLRVSGHYLLTQEGPMGYDPEADAIKLEVIGMVYNEEVDVLALKRFAQDVRDGKLKRDDVRAQVGGEALARGAEGTDPEPGENDGPGGPARPEDRPKDDGNGLPDTNRHAGP